MCLRRSSGERSLQHGSKEGVESRHETCEKDSTSGELLYREVLLVLVPSFSGWCGQPDQSTSPALPEPSSGPACLWIRWRDPKDRSPPVPHLASGWRQPKSGTSQSDPRHCGLLVWDGVAQRSPFRGGLVETSSGAGRRKLKDWHPQSLSAKPQRLALQKTQSKGYFALTGSWVHFCRWPWVTVI